MYTVPIIIIFTLITANGSILNPKAYRAWKHQLSKHSEFEKISIKNQLRTSANENILQPRIIGGRPAKFGEAPYYLRVVIYREFKCGATLLNYRGLSYALTAAHCVWEGEYNLTHVAAATTPPQHIQIVGADLDMEKHSTREQWFRVAHLEIHSAYDPRFDTCDIAVLFLDRYVFESLGIEHAPLPYIGWDDPETVNIAGHGAKLRFDLQAQLQILELETVPRDFCQATLDHWLVNRTLSYQQFCVGHPAVWIEQGTCFGDSGGPVIAYNYTRQEWYLAGIVSYSQFQACGTPGAITIMTKVSQFVPWIINLADLWLIQYGTGNPYTNGTPEDFR